MENNKDIENNKTPNQDNIFFKNCPNCNTECKLEQKYCMNCGHLLSNNYCPECGNECSSEQNFCPKCGHKLIEEKEEVEKEFSKSINKKINYFKTLLVILFFLLLGFIYLAIPKDDKNITPGCDDASVKETALNIFKDNNIYYKDINPTSINNIELQYSVIDGHDESIDRYYCSGEIVITANRSGFIPSSTEVKNNYYNLIAHEYIFGDWYWDRYTKYSLPIKYTAQKSEDGVLVTLNQDYSKGKFSTTNGSDRMESKKQHPQASMPVTPIYNKQTTQPTMSPKTNNSPKPKAKEPIKPKVYTKDELKTAGENDLF